MERIKVMIVTVLMVSFSAFAQDRGTMSSSHEERIKSPQEIQAELDRNEVLFKEAQEMFDPWYAGPLLTGGAGMMPPGSLNMQPYFFFTDYYGAWDHKGKTVHGIPHKKQLNPVLGLQTGITRWLDLLINIQGFENWQSHKHSGGFGDTSIFLGFPLLKEGLRRPAVKFVIGETFPSGRYQHLSSHKLGLDSTGAGSYQTSIGLRVSKVVFWSYKHPMRFRGSFGYTIPSNVHVSDFNSYGGGFGTSGRVHPGDSLTANFAFEYSFTQRWVFASDFVYVWSNSTTFRGDPGTTSSGAPASVGGKSNDQLSIAPAIEYNPNANLGFIAGVWFDVWGRSTPKFVSGIVTVTYTVSW